MSSQKLLRAVAASFALLAAPFAASALAINPTYIGPVDWNDVDGLGTDATVTFNAAIDVWESLILDDITVDVDVTFSDIGSVGLWQGGFSAFVGDDVGLGSPTITTNIITFDLSRLTAGDFFFDQSPGEAGDLPGGAIDAMTTALHELGHMIGFNSLYRNDFGTATESFPWLDLITTDIFDPSGLNVPMQTGDPGHLLESGAPGGLLMEPITYTGERILPSAMELDMLSLAYGYTVVPLPAALPLMFGAVGCLAFMRRRIAG